MHIDRIPNRNSPPAYLLRETWREKAGSGSRPWLTCPPFRRTDLLVWLYLKAYQNQIVIQGVRVLRTQVNLRYTLS